MLPTNSPTCSASSSPDPFAALRAVGPIASERWNDVGEGLLAELRAERWIYGNNKQFLELSCR
jgi:hypothetical protein